MHRRALLAALPTAALAGCSGFRESSVAPPGRPTPVSTDGSPQPFSNDIVVVNLGSSARTLDVEVRKDGESLFERSYTVDRNEKFTIRDPVEHGLYELTVTVDGVEETRTWRATDCLQLSVVIRQTFTVAVKSCTV